MSDFTPADLKAILAQHGQTLDADAQVTFLDRPEPGSAATVIVLERVVEGVVPDYCTHGYATCINCEAPCWIGHASKDVLLEHRAVPCCLECAKEIIPPDAESLGNVHDHRRADGPHR